MTTVVATVRISKSTTPPTEQLLYMCICIHTYTTFGGEGVGKKSVKRTS